MLPPQGLGVYLEGKGEAGGEIEEEKKGRQQHLQTLAPPHPPLGGGGGGGRAIIEVMAPGTAPSTAGREIGGKRTSGRSTEVISPLLSASKAIASLVGVLTAPML